MSLFFISAIIDGVDTRFILDATTKIQVVEPGKLTKFPVQDGATVSDNYVNDNVKISFSGKVSDVKSISSPLYYTLNKRTIRANGVSLEVPLIERVPYVSGKGFARAASSVDSYIKGLKNVKKSKIPFIIEAGEIGTFDNCFFTNLVISQDSTTGTKTSGHGNLSAVNITFTVEQVRFGTKAKQTKIRNVEFKKTLAAKETKPGGKQELTWNENIRSFLLPLMN